MQQPEETATESESQRPGGLGLVGERAVVQPELLEGVPEVVELVRVDGIETAEHHRLGLTVSLQYVAGGTGRLGDGLTRPGLADVLDTGDEIADLTGTERGDGGVVGAPHPHLEGVVGGSGMHEPQSGSRCQVAVHHPQRADHAPILIEVGVEDERLERLVGVAHGRRDPLDDGIEELGDALAGLGRDAQDLIGGEPEHGFDLLGIGVGIRSGEIDLVEARHDLEVVLQREVAVGKGLGLDALAGVDHEDHALTGGQRAADLVAEVNVTGGVDEMDGVIAVVQTHRLQLDGDPPLAFDVHRVEVLIAHVPRVDGSADLEDAVGEGGLAVVDVGDDRQIADVGEVGHGPAFNGATLADLSERSATGRGNLVGSTASHPSDGRSHRGRVSAGARSARPNPGRDIRRGSVRLPHFSATQRGTGVAQQTRSPFSGTGLVVGALADLGPSPRCRWNPEVIRTNFATTIAAVWHRIGVAPYARALVLRIGGTPTSRLQGSPWPTSRARSSATARTRRLVSGTRPCVPR